MGILVSPQGENGRPRPTAQEFTPTLFPLPRAFGPRALPAALVAATALSLSGPLCTVKHFRHIPGLITEQPYHR